MAGIILIAAIIGIVVLILLLRKKFFALLLDLAIGTVVYMAILFLIALVGIKIPVDMAAWGLPITLAIMIGYHMITNFSLPSKSKGVGAL